MLVRLALASLLVLSGCAPTLAGTNREAASSRLPVPARDLIVPLVDAHQHLMSPTAQAVVVPHPELPPISLPAELDALLRANERSWGAPPVGPLFTEDGIILQTEEGRWWKGHARIDRFTNNLERGPRFIPKAYAADGSAGYIAGNVRMGASEHDNLNFLLGIRKGQDGRWQIASEMVSEIKPPVYDRPITADRIIELLDDAGIRYGVVLSVAYWFGAPMREPPVQHELEKTRAENDWVVAQAARYPERLIPFCSVNPLKDYALAELERCAAMPSVRGMKLHLANSRVDLKKPEHVEKLRQFFKAANDRHLALVVHAKTQGGYSRAQGEIMLNQILPAAPDVPVQIAHMANSWDVAKFYADAIAAGDARTKNLYFDLTQAVPLSADDQTPEAMADMADMAATMRRIGLRRIFYGTDMDVGGNPAPREHWKAIRKLPLTDDELRVIAENHPPYIH